MPATYLVQVRMGWAPALGPDRFLPVFVIPYAGVVVLAYISVRVIHQMGVEVRRAQELGIDKVPGIALLGKKDYYLRYFGLPSGYDFIPFVETIRAVGDDNPGVSRETAAMLAKLTKPVQIPVFVTQS